MQKNVFVLGASGDIGKEICRQLQAENYDLILHYHRNRDSIEKLVHELGIEA